MATINKINVNGTIHDIGINDNNISFSQGSDNIMGVVDYNYILPQNFLAQLNSKSAKFEWSRDAGATWTDYNVTDAQSSDFFTYGTNFICGNPSNASEVSVNNRLRITIQNQETDNNTPYAHVRKFAINVSTSGSDNCWCTLRACKASNYNGDSTVESSWTYFATKMPVFGWSGWNIIKLSQLFCGQNTNPYHYWQFIFGYDIAPTNPDINKGLRILQITGYCSALYDTASRIFRKSVFPGTVHVNNEVTFPSTVTATSFIKSGGTSSQFLKANGSVDTTTYLKQDGSNGTSAGVNALITKLPIWTSAPTDNSYIIRQDIGGTDTYGRVKASQFWTYIKGKADSTYLPKTTIALKNPTALTISVNGTSTVYDGSIAKTVTITTPSTSGFLKIDGSNATSDTSKALLNVLQLGQAPDDAYFPWYSQTQGAGRYELLKIWDIYCKPSADSLYASLQHTHTYAGSSSVGGAATSANKVNTNLVLKLNGGTTEGTNQFTFNGSAAKTVNITASSIGAAVSSHTHTNLLKTDGSNATSVGTWAQLSLLPGLSDLSAITSMTTIIASNGSDQTKFVRLSYDTLYQGFKTKLDGLYAVNNHTHNYAASSAPGGNATIANKVVNNLVITLNGGTTEGTNKFTYNGSVAKTINIQPGGATSANINGQTVTFANSSNIIPCYIQFGTNANTKYQARINGTDLQIYRNNTWATVVKGCTCNPNTNTPVTVDSTSALNDAINNGYRNIELDDGFTEKLVLGNITFSDVSLTKLNSELTLTTSAYIGKSVKLDNIRHAFNSFLGDTGGKFFAENDINTMLSSGNNFILTITVRLTPTPRVVVECYVEY